MVSKVEQDSTLWIKYKQTRIHSTNKTWYPEIVDREIRNI